jgi:hypothetical protein
MNHGFRNRAFSCAALVLLLSPLPSFASDEDAPSAMAPTTATVDTVAPAPSVDSQSRYGGFDSDNLFFGGGVGLAFGDVTYIELAPLLGYRVAPQASVGASLIYRYRNDDRYRESFSTSDYGGSVFGRYHVYQPLFLHAEIEYLSYEYVRFDFSTERDNFTSYFLGAGVDFPIGPRTSMFLLGMYNFAYDSGEPSPYDSPWVIRFGVGVGF